MVYATINHLAEYIYIFYPFILIFLSMPVSFVQFKSAIAHSWRDFVERTNESEGKAASNWNMVEFTLA